LLRNVGVPALICQKVSKIDKNVCKTKLKKLNRAVGSPFGNPRTVKTTINNSPTGNSDEDRKTHQENKKKTYQREYKKSDRERPPENQNPQRNQNLPRVCKFEWAYKPAADQMEELIDPTGHNLESESRAVEKNVSSDRNREETYLERSRCGNHDDNRERTYLGKSRSGNRDGGEPGQELRWEWKIHRAHWSDGQLENKNENIQKKNKRETYLGEWEESRDKENCGRRAREPA
jgi:hypothetical protein